MGCMKAVWPAGILLAFALAAPLSQAGQSAPPADPSSFSSSSSSSKHPGESSSSSAMTPPTTTPYNPLPAEKDVEVATFYMRKGDPDAAIPRLEDAIQLKPDYAKPRAMLAQIYEKKGEKDNALKYYREYLKVYPHAPDAKKIQEKIAKLSN